jgi:hypothetical protein
MAYSATGTAGNDTLNQSGDSGPGTIVGLAGDDTILTGSGLAASPEILAMTVSCCGPAISEP